MCPNIKLIGFGEGDIQATGVFVAVVKRVNERTNLAHKTVVTYYPGTQVLDARTGESRPYLCICNTREPGTEQENMVLTEALKDLGYDIEWAEIEEFFMAPECKRWTGE